MILVNEFPDAVADAAVKKRTLVVRLGVPSAVWVYRIALVMSFIIAIAAMIFHRLMFLAGLFYLITLPIAIIAFKCVNREDLVRPSQYRASRITILLHIIGTLALTAGSLICGLCNKVVLY